MHDMTWSYSSNLQFALHVSLHMYFKNSILSWITKIESEIVLNETSHFWKYGHTNYVYIPVQMKYILLLRTQTVLVYIFCIPSWSRLLFVIWDVAQLGHANANIYNYDLNIREAHSLQTVCLAVAKAASSRRTSNNQLSRHQESLSWYLHPV